MAGADPGFLNGGSTGQVPAGEGDDAWGTEGVFLFPMGMVSSSPVGDWSGAMLLPRNFLKLLTPMVLFAFCLTRD